MNSDDIERGRRIAETGQYKPGAFAEPDDIPPPLEPAEEPDDSSDDKAKRRSVAAQLVDLARSEYTLGITETDEPFGVHRDRPHIAMMLRGGKTGLRAELARRYFAETNVVPSQQALADACMVLEGYAAQEVPRPVHLRVAEERAAVYIDMGDTGGRVIEIRGGKWSVIDSAPVLFRRTKLTGELPHPNPGGDLSKLWEFAPVSQADRPVVLAFLVAALVQAGVPHPILWLLAEQGMTKSSATRAFVDLLDPSAVPLRQPPRDPDGWTTAAAASWVVALDNLSGQLSDWLSDSLCRASTGDGQVKRALYTDGDVAVVQFRRVIIANGVDVVIERGDLAERSALADLERPQRRRSEYDLAEAWAEAHPYVLGALLDLAAAVHHRLPAVAVADMPRMADFAKVLVAVDKVLGTKGMARYRERSKRVAADTLDVPFVAELVERTLSFTDSTSAEILAALTPTGADWKPPKEWPKTARAVTGQLTRHAPALRTQGWVIDHDAGRNEAGTRKWTISPPEKVRQPDPSSPSNPSVHVNGRKYDGLETGHGSETGYDGSETGHGNLLDPSENSVLTSANRATGQTGHDSGPSLVPSDACRFCGAELKYSSARVRGHCSGARCLQASRDEVAANKDSDG